MKRRVLATFSSGEKSKRKKGNTNKEKKNVLELLAAGVTRMNMDNNEGVSVMQGFAGFPRNRLQQLLCSSEGDTYMKGSKTGVREWLEKRHSGASRDTHVPKYRLLIMDSMQDVMMKQTEFSVLLCNETTE